MGHHPLLVWASDQRGPDGRTDPDLVADEARTRDLGREAEEITGVADDFVVDVVVGLQ